MSIIGTGDLQSKWTKEQNNNWSISDEVAEVLITELQTKKPKLSLELGTGTGKSTSIITQYSEKIFTIDQDERRSDKARMYLYDVFGEKAKDITFITGYDVDKLKGKKFDFIFVDGPKGQNRRNTFIQMYPFIAKQGTMVIFDDAHRDDVRSMCVVLSNQYGATYYIKDSVAKLIQTCKLEQ